MVIFSVVYIVFVNSIISIILVHSMHEALVGCWIGKFVLEPYFGVIALYVVEYLLTCLLTVEGEKKVKRAT